MNYEFTLSDALVTAERDFVQRFGYRLRSKGTDSVFPRWLSINYGIETRIHHLRWGRTELNGPFWRYSSHRSDELLTMFKLKYG